MVVKPIEPPSWHENPQATLWVGFFAGVVAVALAWGVVVWSGLPEQIEKVEEYLAERRWNYAECRAAGFECPFGIEHEDAIRIVQHNAKLPAAKETP